MIKCLKLIWFLSDSIRTPFYSSWGPDDDGKTVDGPHHLANLALRHGVYFGRQGYGSIYVVASGNGGSAGDNCNYDGYANSIFTITIGAVDETGHMPYYAEECASMLAVTFSSGSSLMRSIVCIIYLSPHPLKYFYFESSLSYSIFISHFLVLIGLSAKNENVKSSWSPQIYEAKVPTWDPFMGNL